MGCPSFWGNDEGWRSSGGLPQALISGLGALRYLDCCGKGRAYGGSLGSGAVPRSKG